MIIGLIIIILCLSGIIYKQSKKIKYLQDIRDSVIHFICEEYMLSRGTTKEEKYILNILYEKWNKKDNKRYKMKYETRYARNKL